MKKIDVRAICECAVLIALEIVLERFASFKALGLKFGISFVPMVLCAMLYGPWLTAACYAVADLIGALLFPFGAYFPGFTLTCALIGICYGFFFYKKEKLNWLSVIAAPLIVCGLLGLGLNTFWMSVIYTSKTFLGWFLYRAPQQAGLFILHIVFLPILFKLLKKLRRA